MRQIPYVTNITGLGTAFQKEGLLKKLVTAMYKVGLKKAKVVFFENAENRQIFLDKKIVREEQTCLLHGAGVNLEHFQYTEYPIDDGTTRLLLLVNLQMKGVSNEKDMFYYNCIRNTRFVCAEYCKIYS